MNNQEIIKLHDENIMGTYGRFPVVLEKGHGASAIDADGKEYIDFGSGIGTNSLGYCDDGWVEAVTRQLHKIQHVSNYYYNEPNALAAKKLCEISGYDKVFFGNSGAEANECAIKLARKYSVDRHSRERTTIISLKNSFHGRTVTTLSATGQDVFHQYFFPFTEGFRYARANSMESVRELTDDTVCAVMLEFIQGEGGVLPLEEGFVKELAGFCKAKKLLLIADEVQTGVGRTGSFYCFQQYGVTPDIVTSAKGLGGGLPIGACLCTKELAGVLSVGMHGSTFGGNPVACAGAVEVLNRVGNEDFLKQVREKGAYLRKRLEQLPWIREVRGKGLMLGADLKDGCPPAKDVMAACLESGLLILTAKTSMRFLPPLTITYGEMEKGLGILEEVLNKLSQ